MQEVQIGPLLPPDVDAVVEIAIAAWQPIVARLRQEMGKEVFQSQRAKRVRASDRDWEQKLLDTFVVDGRLTGIPAQRKKRLVILQWLARKLEPDVRYTERELNEAIKRYHPDSASLRRALVSWKFMHRKGGVYWRVPEDEQLQALTGEVSGDENVLEVLRRA